MSWQAVRLLEVFVMPRGWSALFIVTGSRRFCTQQAVVLASTESPARQPCKAQSSTRTGAELPLALVPSGTAPWCHWQGKEDLCEVRYIMSL